MAYSQSWDESAPDGSEAANTIDTIIQNLKEALRERLEQVIPDFGDDSVDPKVISAEGPRNQMDYQADNAAGSKLLQSGTWSNIYLLTISGDTDGSGDITLEGSEVAQWLFDNGIIDALGDLSAGIVYSPVVSSPDDMYISQYSGSFTDSTDATFRIADVATQTAQTSTSVVIRCVVGVRYD